MRPANPVIFQLSDDELGVSFVTPEQLTPFEEMLGTLVTIIESSLRD